MVTRHPHAVRADGLHHSDCVAEERDRGSRWRGLPRAWARSPRPGSVAAEEAGAPVAEEGATSV